MRCIGWLGVLVLAAWPQGTPHRSYPNPVQSLVGQPMPVRFTAATDRTVRAGKSLLLIWGSVGFNRSSGCRVQLG